MRKILVGFVVLVAILMIVSNSYAYYTANASPITVQLSSTNTQVSKSWSFDSRDIWIRNYSSIAYVYIDLKDSTNTTDKNKAVLVGPSDELYLRDFQSRGLSFMEANDVANGYASPVSVLITY